MGFVLPFPGEFAGASLKLFYLYAIGPGKYSVPRRIRRGLIEAATPGQTRRSCLRTFPGEFAGASLKQSYRTHGRLTLALRSRRIRRGLIEAPMRGRSLPARWPFPGEFAGASLKRRSSWTPARRRRPFPGEFAGASLKPVKPIAQCEDWQTFPGEFAGASLKRLSCGCCLVLAQGLVPRRIRRGLIEAARSTVLDPSPCPPVPRRIRRGLIEAMSARSLTPGNLRSFPGEFAGASLKLGHLNRPSHKRFRAVPRQIRRGLIEAWSVSSFSPGVPGRSPANSPGPH